MTEQFELEAAVLLLAMRNPAARDILLAAAQPEWFTDLRHQYVFDAIRRLHGQGLPIDAAVIRKETTLHDPIDSAWFEQAKFLAKDMTRDTYEQVHLPALREAFQVRSLAAISGDLCERAQTGNGTSQELLSWLDGRLEALRKGESVDVRIQRESELIGSIGAKDAPPENPAVSGIKELDDFGVRFDPGKNTVVAARPKHGKSSLIDQIAITLSGRDGVALFNLEMGFYGWRERRIPQITKGVSFENYALGRADEMAYHAVSLYEQFARNRGLYIIEPAGGAISASGILASVRKMRRDGISLGYVIVDQMQQLADWDSTRRNEGRDMQPTRIIRELTNGCKSLGVHLIMVQQLARAADNRKDKEPIMADLAETAYFERVADQMLFVYRPNFDADENHMDDHGYVKVVSRYGANGRIRLPWDGSRTQFGAWGDPVMLQVYEALRSQDRDIA
jgi:replicative DNA helicase